MKILVAYDGSEAAGHALTRAGQVAQRGGGDVTVISVVPIQASGPRSAGPVSPATSTNMPGSSTRRSPSSRRPASRRPRSRLSATRPSRSWTRPSAEASSSSWSGTADGTESQRFLLGVDGHPRRHPRALRRARRALAGHQSAAARDCAARAGSRLRTLGFKSPACCAGRRSLQTNVERTDLPVRTRSLRQRNPGSSRPQAIRVPPNATRLLKAVLECAGG